MTLGRGSPKRSIVWCVRVLPLSGTGRRDQLVAALLSLGIQIFQKQALFRAQVDDWGEDPSLKCFNKLTNMENQFFSVREH
jgi:hypothetical protein